MRKFRNTRATSYEGVVAVFEVAYYADTGLCSTGLYLMTIRDRIVKSCRYVRLERDEPQVIAEALLDSRADRMITALCDLSEDFTAVVLDEVNRVGVQEEPQHV